MWGALVGNVAEPKPQNPKTMLAKGCKHLKNMCSDRVSTGGCCWWVVFGRLCLPSAASI